MHERLSKHRVKDLILELLVLTDHHFIFVEFAFIHKRRTMEDRSEPHQSHIPGGHHTRRNQLVIVCIVSV